ncbi:ShlB/FhaC/HecB family hemolysin secretion/activation protein [Roseateles sp. PN1]|uniref:ShlB/FhaC/HecB family hemolysin secretion/activation protein n=1 Tax=Roseateles sp. PN1 TaxID=3137372 RepID=UPI0031390BFE
MNRRLGVSANSATAQVTLTCAVVMFAPVLAEAANAEGERPDVGVVAESLRRADERPALPRPAAKTVIRANQPRVQTGLSGLRMSLGELRFEGDSGVSSTELNKVLAPWAGRELSFSEYETAVHAVAKYLRENGHPQAEVRVSTAQVQGGQVAIAIQGLSPVASPTRLAQVAAVPELPPQQAEPRVFVKTFKVDGVVQVAAAEIQAKLEPFAERALTLQQLDQATAAVAGLLQEKGYGLAQAYLPPQRIDSGEVTIAVQQGVVDATPGQRGLKIEGAGERVQAKVIEEVLAPAVRPGEPLNTLELDRALRLAAEVPGIKSARAALSPGEQPGSTQAVATVEEARLVSGSVWADNHGSPYVGTGRSNALVNLNSPAGLGEQYSLNLSHSSGMDSVKLASQMLAGPQGGKLGASWSNMRMTLGQDVTALDLNSRSTIFSLFGSLPMERSVRRNSTLLANLDFKRLDNSVVGTLRQTRSLDVGSLTWMGDALDASGAQWAWNGTASLGRLSAPEGSDLAAMDRQTARTIGSFGKLNAGFSRLARVAADPAWSFYASLSAQLASRNLDGAEKFQLGGPTGVRAYPVGEGLGDDGWLGTAELRYSFVLPQGQMQLFAFYDAGGLRQYKELWQNALPAGRPNYFTLQGAGLGAQVSYLDQGSVRLVYANKLGSNPNPTAANTDSDGQSKNSRIWVIGNIAF